MSNEEIQIKAKELVDYHRTYVRIADPYSNLLPSDEIHIAKQYAVKTCDEAIKICPYMSKDNCETVEQLRADDSQFASHWGLIKQAIETL